jgi:hypothetical protein
VYETPQNSAISPLPAFQEVGSSIKNSPLPEKPYTVNPDTVSPDTEKPHLLNNKDTKNNITNNTAADGSFFEQPDAAAVDKNKTYKSSSLISVSPVIGKTLSPSQQTKIQAMLKELSLNPVNHDPEKIFQVIADALINPNCFTRAGNDFFKKLHTIKKAIRHGKFSLPLSSIKQAQEGRVIELKNQIDQWLSEKQSLNRAIKETGNLSIPEFEQSCLATLTKIDKKIAECLKEKQYLESQFFPTEKMTSPENTDDISKVMEVSS